MKKNIALMALTGILTLASCGQNGGGDGADPVATIGAVTTPNPLTSAGGTVKVTGTVTDDVAVKSVVVTRGSTTLTCSVTGLTTKSANFSCDDTLVGNASTTDAVSYTYKVVGTDTADKTGSASTSVSVPKATSTPQPQPGNGPVIKITSPSDGANAPLGTPITVTFTSDKALDSATCTIGSSAAVAATVTSSGGFCVVTPTASGNNIITVTGKKGTDTGSATVGVQTPAAPVTPVAPVTLGDGQIDAHAFDSCMTQPALNAWMVKTDVGSGVNYPVDQATNFFVKGTVRVNLNKALAAGDVVEAYFQSTQPGSAVQKLDVKKDAKGAYVNFDSAYGQWAANSGPSQEGFPTTLWFRVNNVDVNKITIYPDNLAPEAVNPQVDAVRRVNAGGQIWMAGDINLYATNTAVEDKPLGSDKAVNAGFQQVCYYVVPESAGIVDYKGDNPEGLSAYTKSIRAEKVYSSATPITSAGQNSTGGGRYFQDTTVKTADVTPDANGFVVNKLNLPDGRYKVYTIAYDKLGNERPAATPYLITLDNTAPNLSGISVAIADDSPLPFPAEPGYVSDYAKISVKGSLAGADGAGIGVDLKSATCSFNNMDLFATGPNPVSDGNPASPFYWNDKRVDSNKWADGVNKVSCGRTVKDLLGNYNPNAVVTSTAITVDNIDPTINVTNADMSGALTAGKLYRPDATVRDEISGVRSSYLFWAPLTSQRYMLMNPVEMMRADQSHSTLSGIEWRAPSFDDQYFKPDAIGIFGLVIDHAGNATLRTKLYNYTSDGKAAFNGIANIVASSVYLNSSFPLTPAQKNQIVGAKNQIFGVTSGDTLETDNRVATLAGDTTLEVNSLSVTPTYGTLEVPKAYGRFNAVDWEAIRNYMVTPAKNQNTMAFPGSAVDGDLLNNTLTTYANFGSTVNAGDPSYLSAGAHRVTSDQRLEWNVFTAPWMTLQGVTNTPDVDNVYKLTNSLRNDNVMFGTWTRGRDINTPASRYPINCPTDTYCTSFNQKYDQISMIFTAGDGDFIYTGRNLK